MYQHVINISYDNGRKRSFWGIFNQLHAFLDPKMGEDFFLNFFGFVTFVKFPISEKISANMEGFLEERTGHQKDRLVAVSLSITPDIARRPKRDLDRFRLAVM